MSHRFSSPKEYRIPVSQEHIRSFRNPHMEEVSVIHAFVKIKDFPNGEIPDKINPRCHENPKGKVPRAIKGSLYEQSDLFHMLNRGCLIIAKKAWYDNKERILHFIIESDEDHGMVDGATTDRVLSELKRKVSKADFSSLHNEEIPDYFQDSFLHIEIIAGDIDSDLRIKLAEARNTSLQVKEFALEDLRGAYDWIQEVVESSKFKGKIRYSEGAPEPVDIRVVLALLTLFHPRWEAEKSDPIVAYTGKGSVLNMYLKDEYIGGYQRLSKVLCDILELYEYIHAHFQEQYVRSQGNGAKLGRKKKEIRYIKDGAKAKRLPLTGSTTKYVIPDGWLYPILASFRMLLDWENEHATWKVNPFTFFDEHGAALVAIVVEMSAELGNNPNALGKSKVTWSALKEKTDYLLLKNG